MHTGFYWVVFDVREVIKKKQFTILTIFNSVKLLKCWKINLHLDSVKREESNDKEKHVTEISPAWKYCRRRKIRLSSVLFANDMTKTSKTQELATGCQCRLSSSIQNFLLNLDYMDVRKSARNIMNFIPYQFWKGTYQYNPRNDLHDKSLVVGHRGKKLTNCE